jgi:Erv1 / Alr family
MCSCKQGKIQGVETTEWGPHFWSVLHSTSLKAGTAVLRAQAEETRTWTRVFETTGHAIPCPECRTHYKEWILTHPFKNMHTLPYGERGDWIRHWWYDLHADVNRRLGKENLDYADLACRYKDVNFRFEMATINKYMNIATHADQVKIMEYISWKKHMTILNSLYY